MSFGIFSGAAHDDVAWERNVLDPLTIIAGKGWLLKLTQVQSKEMMSVYTFIQRGAREFLILNFDYAVEKDRVAGKSVSTWNIRPVPCPSMENDLPVLVVL